MTIFIMPASEPGPEDAPEEKPPLPLVDDEGGIADEGPPEGIPREPSISGPPNCCPCPLWL